MLSAITDCVELELLMECSPRQDSARGALPGFLLSSKIGVSIAIDGEHIFVGNKLDYMSWSSQRVFADADKFVMMRLSWIGHTS